MPPGTASGQARLRGERPAARIATISLFLLRVLKVSTEASRQPTGAIW